MDLSHDLSAPEYYQLVMVRSGLAPVPLEMSKVAEQLGVPVEIATLAKSFNEQLMLDGVPYKTAADRRDDAVRMATALSEFKTALYQQAAQDADKLMVALEEAASKVAAETSLRGLSIPELLKIAALQSESKAEHDAAQKVANAATPVVPAPHNPAATAAAPIASLYHNKTVSFENLDPNKAVAHVASGLGYTGDATGHRDFIARQLGVENDKNLDSHVHNLLHTTNELGNEGQLSEGLSKYRESMTANKPGWMRRNVSWLVPAGLLGAGAVYALSKRRKDADEKNQK